MLIVQLNDNGHHCHFKQNILPNITYYYQIYYQIYLDHPCQILVEISSWRDRNLKFGPNCDLEVDDLEKKLIFFPNHHQITICGPI